MPIGYQPAGYYLVARQVIGDSVNYIQTGTAGGENYGDYQTTGPGDVIGFVFNTTTTPPTYRVYKNGELIFERTLDKQNSGHPTYTLTRAFVNMV